MTENKNSYERAADELRLAIITVERSVPSQDLQSARKRLQQLEEQAKYVELSIQGQDFVRALEKTVGTEEATKAAISISNGFNELLEINRETVEWVKKVLENFHPQLLDPGMRIADPAWMEKYPS